MSDTDQKVTYIAVESKRISVDTDVDFKYRIKADKNSNISRYTGNV